jgi:hypothetical protein
LVHSRGAIHTDRPHGSGRSRVIAGARDFATDFFFRGALAQTFATQNMACDVSRQQDSLQNFFNLATKSTDKQLQTQFQKCRLSRVAAQPPIRIIAAEMDLRNLWNKKGERR